jgi:hypothetical protein
VTFTFEFTVETAEQVRASRIMYHRQRSTRVTYAFFVALPALVLVFQAVSLSSGRAGWWPGVLIVLVTCAAAIVATYLSPRWTVASLRKNNRAAGGPHTYKLSSLGLEASAPGTTTTFEWANVAECYESNEFLFLYISKGFAALLPRRVVKPEDLPSLRVALREWLGEKAHLLAS